MNKARSKSVKSRGEEQGFVLIIGVIVMISLLLLTLPFLFQLSLEHRLTDKSFKSSAALFLAEAGIERAIWELNYGDISSWTGDSQVRTMNISSFQASGGNVIGDVDIRVIDPDGDTPVVESTGRVAYIGSLKIIRTARAVLNGDKYRPWTHGVFGDDELNLSSNAMIDSYDSRDGPYGGSNVGSEGHVGTNSIHYGCIDLSSYAIIYGNAFSGPGINPDSVIITRSNSHIYGEKLSLSELKEMPQVLPPEGLFYNGDYFLGSNNLDTISESGVYTSFRLDSNAKVTITADVILYITGDFSMLNNTKLEITDGVNVTIYLGGSFEQSSTTQINNLSDDPTKLLVLGTDSFNGVMEWKSNSDFWGAVYVPKASIEFSSNSDFHGSIVAQSIDLSSYARIHYDEALADLNIVAAGESSSYNIKSWQEKLSPIE